MGRSHRHTAATSLAAVFFALVAVPAPVPAGTIPAGEPFERTESWRVTLGPVAGALLLDQDLANYRWDTRPAVQSGMQASLFRGRYGVRARLWRAHTTQASGIPGDDQSARVALTGIDVTAQARLFRYRALDVWGLAHGGSLHVGYDPDRMTFDLGGGSAPVTVDYAPITELEMGAGLELRARATRWLELAAQVEQSSFALDTAHRRGDDIVTERERFFNWSFRFQASWRYGFR